MIKRTLWQFDLFTDDETSRDEIYNLRGVLADLLPQYEISTESAKSDLIVLRIAIDEASQ